MRRAPLVVLLMAVLAVPLGAQDHEFKLMWGSYGRGDGQLRYPYGVATDAAGNVYVADRDNHRIQKFTSYGELIGWWGKGSSTTGWHAPNSGEIGGYSGNNDGQFRFPHGIATDGAGNVYVADRDNRRIQKFTSDGVLLGWWGKGSSTTGWHAPGSGETGGYSGSGDGQFQAPFGIATDGAGNVYVTDIGNHRIQKFDSTGGFERKWGSRGSHPGEFYVPTGVATAGAACVYVADRNNHRIQTFDSSGKYLSQWGGYGGGPGDFNYPFQVATDATGDVYVSDEYNHRIQKFDSTGGFLTEWGSYGTSDGQFRYPRGVTTDGAGYWYVADHGNHRIQKFGPAATAVSLLVSMGGFIMGEVAVGAIPAELENSLLVKVDGALEALDRGNPNDAKVAMNDLKALVNHVEAQSSENQVEAQSSEDPDANKKIPWDTAQAIIGQANAIIAMLEGDTTTTATAAATSDLVAEPAVTVQIDADPAADPNCVALGTDGVLPVAILSSDGFDATQVDPASVMLMPSDGLAVMDVAGIYTATEEDVNADGLLDLVVQVEVINFAPDTVQEGTVWLGAHTYAGQPVEGADVLAIVPLE